ARRRQDLLRPRDAVVQHAPRIVADRVVDARRRNAMAVLQDRVERDAVVLFGEVLADRGDADTMTSQRPEYAMVLGAPRQTLVAGADHRLHDRPDAAAELERVAAHEVAGRIGLVELHAPQA